MPKVRTPHLIHLPRPPQHGYTLLLVALMMLMLVGPVIRQVIDPRFVDSLLILVVLVAGLYSVSSRTGLRGVLVLVGLTFALSHFMFFAGSGAKGAQLGIEITAMLFFGLVAVAIIQDVLGRGDNVSWSLINGALAAYLLVGIAFALLFSLLSNLDPASFDGASRAAGDDFGRFIYLSFVTLTTLGYGDITPGTPIAGAMLTFEALVGQIYLTVLVARLVGMRISMEAAEQTD